MATISKTLLTRTLRLFKEGGWIFAGHVATLLGSLALVRVLTEYLDPAEYGKLALGLSVAGLANQVVFGGISAGIARYYSIAAEQGNVVGYLAVSRQLVALASAALVAAGSLLVGALLWIGRYEWASLASAVLLLSVFNGYNAISSSLQNAARQRAIVALHSGLDAWLRISLAVCAILLLGPSSTAVVLGYGLGAFLVSMSQYRFVRRLAVCSTPSVALVQPWARDIWLYSWPIVVGGVFNWGYYSSQRWALELFGSTDDVGRFYALTQIAYAPISVVGAMLLSFITPILFARAGAPTNHDRVNQVHVLMTRLAVIGLALTATMAFGSYLIREPLVALLVAPSYRDVFVYMPWVVLAAGLLQVSLTLTTVVMVENRTRTLLSLSVFGNGAIALMNLIATRTWGLPGLATSMVLGSVVHLSWMAVLIYRGGSRPTADMAVALVK